MMRHWTLTVWPALAVIFFNIMALYFSWLTNSNDILKFMNIIGITFGIRNLLSWHRYNVRRKLEEEALRRQVAMMLNEAMSQFLEEIAKDYKSHSDESNSDKT